MHVEGEILSRLIFHGSRSFLSLVVSQRQRYRKERAIIMRWADRIHVFQKTSDFAALVARIIREQQLGYTVRVDEDAGAYIAQFDENWFDLRCEAEHLTETIEPSTPDEFIYSRIVCEHLILATSRVLPVIVALLFDQYGELTPGVRPKSVAVKIGAVSSQNLRRWSKAVVRELTRLENLSATASGPSQVWHCLSLANVLLGSIHSDCMQLFPELIRGSDVTRRPNST